MHPPNPKFEHVYAIIRIDDDMPPLEGITDITITRIVWTQERAQSEVDRLNKLNGEKASYYWQVTRLEKKF